jgi:leucyl/phenylalanyl-tRNA---protein transferase
MAQIKFPDPRLASRDGLLAIGGSLNVTNLLNAYRMGIFPWPMQGYPVTWFCPAKRAILEFKDLHVSKRVLRVKKQSPFQLTINQAFGSVIKSCADIERKGEDGTWITREMIRAYKQLHMEGYAHSVEAWQGERLVGGIYGVEVDGVFSAESMFHIVDYSSKLALLHLIEHLQDRGLDWMDIQVMSPHMKAMGAKDISRDAFLQKLNETHCNVKKSSVY